jgi:iron complex transport system substrate-binding protein
VPAELGPFPKLNPEFVLRERPDVVMGVQHEAAAMLRRPGWAQLPALQQGRRCDLPTPAYEMMVRPGPRLGEAAGILVDCLMSMSAPGAAPGAGR